MHKKYKNSASSLRNGSVEGKSPDGSRQADGRFLRLKLENDAYTTFSNYFSVAKEGSFSQARATIVSLSRCHSSSLPH